MSPATVSIKGKEEWPAISLHGDRIFNSDTIVKKKTFGYLLKSKTKDFFKLKKKKTLVLSSYYYRKSFYDCQ